MQYYKIGYMTAISIAIVQIIVLLGLRDQIIGAFTSEPYIVGAIVDAWPILLIFTFFDATQTVSANFITASGKQCNGALITSSGYVAIGIPLAYYFGIYKGLGVSGLWIGPVAACAYLTLMNNILVCCLDWDNLYTEIEARRKSENEQRDRFLRESLQKRAVNANKTDSFDRADVEAQVEMGNLADEKV